MQNLSKSYRLIFIFILVLVFAYAVQAQDKPPLSVAPPASLDEQLNQQRIAVLPALKNQLEQLKVHNRSEVVIVLSETFFNKLLAELTDVKFNAGSFLTVTINNPHIILKNGLTLAQMQADLASTSTLLSFTSKLNITAQVLIEQDVDQSLLAKLQVLDLQPITPSQTTQPPPGLSASTTEAPAPAPPTISMEQLNRLLPPLKIPLDLDFDHTLRSGVIKQTKPIAIELSLDPRRIQGSFQITDLLPLQGRLAMIAHIAHLSITRGTDKPDSLEKPNHPDNPESHSSTNPPTIKHTIRSVMPNGVSKEVAPNSQDPSSSTTTLLEGTDSLDKEIDILSRDLQASKDFAINANDRLLNSLVSQYVKASMRDIVIKLLPCRVLSSQSDLGFAKYDNYLDIDSGDGIVDFRDAEIRDINNGQIQLYIDTVGQIQAQAHGQQVGFKYQTMPQIGVNFKDQLSFTLESNNGDFFIKPLPKRVNIHFDISVPVSMLGTNLNTSQNFPVDVATIMKPVKLPNLISTNVKLPKGTREVTLTEVNYKAEGKTLRLEANLSFK